MDNFYILVEKQITEILNSIHSSGFYATNNWQNIFSENYVSNKENIIIREKLIK